MNIQVAFSCLLASGRYAHNGSNAGLAQLDVDYSAANTNANYGSQLCLDIFLEKGPCPKNSSIAEQLANARAKDKVVERFW